MKEQNEKERGVGDVKSGFQRSLELKIDVWQSLQSVIDDIVA